MVQDGTGDMLARNSGRGERKSALTNIFTTVVRDLTKDMLVRNSGGDEEDKRAHLYNAPTVYRDEPLFLLEPFRCLFGNILGM